MIQLSHRLKTLAGLVPQASRLADIGSDHAYLPIYLLQKGQVSFAIASEVARGPYRHAQTEVQNHQLEDQIDVRLADGLDAVKQEDQIDCITIAGMGGQLITNIINKALQQGQLSQEFFFVLQPNNDEARLRSFLINHNFHIEDEKLLEENGHSYEILTARYLPHLSQQDWSEEDLYFGKVNQTSNPAVFQDKWQRRLKSIEAILVQLNKSPANQKEKINHFKAERKRIKEKLDEVKRID